MAPKIVRDLMLKLEFSFAVHNKRFGSFVWPHFLNHGDINFQFCSHN